MPLVFHIFYKDARRLWKETAVTWILLACLTRMDSWRSGAAAGSAEGWLNLLLPLAWSYLIGACVLQDALPGERQFWLTLPHRRITLFAAKLLFIAAAIDVPYLVSNALVLEARGFTPFLYLPRLFAKQGLLFLLLTLPSLALASIARNTMQFILLALAVAAAAVLIGGNTGFAPSFYPRFARTMDETRRDLTLILPILAGALMIWLQYRDRRTSLSRGTGLAAIATAAALYLWLSPTSIASLEAALQPLRPTRAVTVRLSQQPGRPYNPGRRGTETGVTAVIPLDITGVSSLEFVSQLGLQIQAPDGFRVSTDLTPGPARRNALLLAGLSPDSAHLVLLMDSAVYNRIAHASVAIRGRLLVEQSQWSRPSALEGFTRRDIPGLGKCAASETGGHLYEENMLRLTCESPDPLPTERHTVADTATGRTWDNGSLGSSITNVLTPLSTWLSPLNRGESYFRVVPGEAGQPGERWLMPESTLHHFRIGFQTMTVIGKAVVDYELPGMELSRFVAQTSR
jgi:hypothetical protein